MYKLLIMSIAIVFPLSGLEMVKKLLAIEQWVLSQDLVTAINDGDERKVEDLINHGVDVNTLNFSGLTPFDYAIKAHNDNICRLLAIGYVLKQFKILSINAYERMLCLLCCYKRIGAGLTFPAPRGIMKTLFFHSDDLGKEIVHGAFSGLHSARNFLRRASAMIGLMKSTEHLKRSIKTLLQTFFERTTQRNIKVLVEDHNTYMLAQLINPQSQLTIFPKLLPNWVSMKYKTIGHDVVILGDKTTQSYVSKYVRQLIVWKPYNQTILELVASKAQ